MFLQALCFAILVAGSFAQKDAAFKPLAAVYTIVPNFKTTEFCTRTCYSDYWMNAGNVRVVTFKGTLKKGETARELCNCIYNYMNQNDWLVGVTPVCYHDLCDNTVTLELTGQPDADYDPYAVDTSLDRPLEKLKEIADQFANNAQLVGIQCRMHWTEDTCGCLHVMVECPIAGETRASGDLCDGIKNYFNQGAWLDNSITNCNARGDTLEVEFIGNKEAGNDCAAPCYYSYE